MLQPKRTRFRKFQKGTIGGILQQSPSGYKDPLSFGSFGLKALNAGRISAQVIESARRTLTRKLRRNGKIWIRIFPDIAVSQKPAEVRMGKGKGNPEYWVARVKAGQMLFELEGISCDLARQACLLASQKFPIFTEFVKRDEFR